MSKHFGCKGLVLGALLWVLAGAGPLLAAGNEVRLPVAKTVRLTPLPEAPADKAAAPAEKKPETPKAEPPKPAAPAPAVKKPEAAKAEPAVAKPTPAAKPSAPAAEPKPAPKAVAPAAAAPPVAKAAPKALPEQKPVPEPKPKAAPEPKPKPAPKPKPEPKVDPLALEMPARPAPQEAVALPEGGRYVGAVELEFLADRVILRAAATAAVERVTHFSLTDPSGPRKLALDLRGNWRKKGPGVLRFDTGPVKAVVTGEHPDRLRLAVEFREGAVAPDMQPQVELGPRGMTATIPLAVRLKHKDFP